jgi:hypothetical protein
MHITNIIKFYANIVSKIINIYNFKINIKKTDKAPGEVIHPITPLFR